MPRAAEIMPRRPTAQSPSRRACDKSRASLLHAHTTNRAERSICLALMGNANVRTWLPSVSRGRGGRGRSLAEQHCIADPTPARRELHNRQRRNWLRPQMPSPTVIRDETTPMWCQPREKACGLTSTRPGEWKDLSPEITHPVLSKEVRRCDALGWRAVPVPVRGSGVPHQRRSRAR